MSWPAAGGGGGGGALVSSGVGTYVNNAEEELTSRDWGRVLVVMENAGAQGRRRFCRR